VADVTAIALGLGNQFHAEALLAAPKIIQALIAAIGDYYTWKLAEYTYGTNSLSTAAALILTVASPWQWFCSTRTFSNSLETSLTIVALYNWPWHWSVAADTKSHFQVDGSGLRIRDEGSPSTGAVDEITRLRRALLFAAVATILRPTNVLIWVALVLLTFLRSAKTQWLVKVPGTEQSALVEATSWSLVPNKQECLNFVRESIVCASTVVGLTMLIDRIYYGCWTFPPLNFLYVNVFQSIAMFYGNNDWHYYLSQGYPLLLTTALPFALLGMYQALAKHPNFSRLAPTSQVILTDLALVSIFVPSVLSLISHKEVRFIYPLLPGLHILAAQPVNAFFGPVFEQAVLASTRKAKYLKASLLAGLLALNLSTAIYTSQIHNSGIINLVHYLRHEFEEHYVAPANIDGANMTVGFLMPCHSTPWRSHFQYPPTSLHNGIDAWALTCHPPLGLNATAKFAYVDEADQFYLEPNAWLKRHMSRHPPTINGRSAQKHEPGVFGQRHRRVFEVETKDEEHLWRERQGRRPWPEYLVFFQQLEPEMTRILRGSGYVECWRGFNSHWHDDWRREGDVITWCLWPERSKTLATTEAQQATTALEAQRAKDRTGAMSKPAPNGLADRVVEKPFWKQRPLLQEPAPHWWDNLPGFGRKKQGRKSWWNGGRWD
jgi:GPI mannosyltransferase 3